MAEQLLAGKRDATFLSRPGKALQRHIAVQDGTAWFARCSGARGLYHGTMLLDDAMLVPAVEVYPVARCQRPGCRVKWPEFVPRPLERARATG